MIFYGKEFEFVVLRSLRNDDAALEGLHSGNRRKKTDMRMND